MSLNTNSTSLRLGRLFFWSNSNLFFKKFYFNYSFLEKKIIFFLSSLLNVITLNHFSLIKKFYSDEVLHQHSTRKILKTPLTLGSCKVDFNLNSILIRFYYYFDLINSHSDQLKYLTTRLQSLICSLHFILKTDVRLYDFNYFKLALGPILSLKSLKKSKLIAIFKNSSLEYIKEVFFYVKLIKVYAFFMKKLKRFSSNQYFFRVLQKCFSVFVLKLPDFEFILRVFKFEFSNLRKQHKKFIFFLFSLITLCFKFFKNKFNIIGIVFIVKGRLVLYNREYRRSVKKKLSIGFFHKSNLNVPIKHFFETTQSRFGAISFNLIVSFSSINLSSNLLICNTSFKNFFSAGILTNLNMLSVWHLSFFFFLKTLNLQNIRLFVYKNIFVNKFIYNIFVNKFIYKLTKKFKLVFRLKKKLNLFFILILRNLFYLKLFSYFTFILNASCSYLNFFFYRPLSCFFFYFIHNFQNYFNYLDFNILSLKQFFFIIKKTNYTHILKFFYFKYLLIFLLKGIFKHLFFLRYLYSLNNFKKVYYQQVFSKKIFNIFYFLNLKIKLKKVKLKTFTVLSVFFFKIFYFIFKCYNYKLNKNLIRTYLTIYKPFLENFNFFFYENLKFINIFISDLNINFFLFNDLHLIFNYWILTSRNYSWFLKLKRKQSLKNKWVV